MDKIVVQADRDALYQRLGLPGVPARPVAWLDQFPLADERLPSEAMPAPSGDAGRAPRVLLHSLQGGVGLSTLAVGLASQLARAGLQARLLDLGRQGQASFYFQEIEPLPGHDAAWLDGRRFGRRLGVICPPAAQPPGFDTLALRCQQVFGEGAEQSFLVADLPAAGHAHAQALLAQVDLAVIPLRPDLFALQAADRMLRLVEAVRAPALFVLNGFNPELRAQRSVQTALHDLLGKRLLDATLPQDPGLADRHMACEPLEAALYRSVGFQALYARCALAAMRRMAHL